MPRTAPPAAAAASIVFCLAPRSPMLFEATVWMPFASRRAALPRRSSFSSSSVSCHRLYFVIHQCHLADAKCYPAKFRSVIAVLYRVPSVLCVPSQFLPPSTRAFESGINPRDIATICACPPNQDKFVWLVEHLRLVLYFIRKFLVGVVWPSQKKCQGFWPHPLFRQSLPTQAISVGAE